MAPAYCVVLGVEGEEPAAGDHTGGVDRANPVGGLMSVSRFATPTFPPSSGKVTTASTPNRSTSARTGPIDAPRFADTSATSSPSRATSPRCTLDSVSPATDSPTGIVASSPAWPRKVMPVSLDQVTPSSKVVRSPSAGRKLARNPSASAGAMTKLAGERSADNASPGRASDSAASSASRAPPISSRTPSGAPKTAAGSSPTPTSVATALPVTSLVPGSASRVNPCRPYAIASTPAVSCRSMVQGPACRVVAIAPNGVMTRPRSPWLAGEMVSSSPASAVAPFSSSST